MYRLLPVIAVCAALQLPILSWAALPLITDDTEMQGAGKFQLEISGAWDRDRETETGIRVEETDYTVTTTLTYGLVDPVDLYVGLPVTSSIQTKEGAETSRATGPADARLGVKWRFFGGKQGLSAAVRPALTLPTGNQEKVLGTGRVTYGTYFIVTYASDPWILHMNLGYVRNENVIDEHKNLWHASAAAVYEIAEHWKLCADVGRDTNRDITSEIEPAYLLAGFIYFPAKQLELSFGMKASLNKPATDWEMLPGLTLHF